MKQPLPVSVTQKSRERSELMKRVRQRNSAPELYLRRALHKQGLRYRIHYRAESVQIDIAFVQARLAIFVDGCYWHGCPIHATYPKKNCEYWLPKLLANKERDERQTARLLKAGWKVIRVWEHDCKPIPDYLVRDTLHICKADGGEKCMP